MEELSDLSFLLRTMRDRSISEWIYHSFDSSLGIGMVEVFYTNYRFRFQDTGKFIEGYQYIGEQWREARMTYARALELVSIGSTINYPPSTPSGTIVTRYTLA